MSGPIGGRLGARCLPSPHQRDRGGAAVDMIVIHHITCPPGSFDPADVEALFLGTLDTAKHPAYREVEGRELSAHFLIDRRGRVTQFVPTDRAAYHAGASRWRGRAGCNDFSVGIELIGDAARAFTARQYWSLARVCRALMRAHPRITPRRIVGHSQVAWPRGRKQDPGPRFDWARFHRLLGTARMVSGPSQEPQRWRGGGGPRGRAAPSEHRRGSAATGPRRRRTESEAAEPQPARITRGAASRRRIPDKEK